MYRIPAALLVLIIPGFALAQNEEEVSLALQLFAASLPVLFALGVIYLMMRRNRE